ncbi:hypothetical protein GCM10010515_68420 [Streptomyces fructofermentans]|uniref:Uncharacterized protein n=1 Tax=Streptomyces fructofermentans TaxID=152141 RepID=A0A918NSR3_9ACTN|nr:hypothetical protein GCM10010515_68420 [Streptomyces fructofermentans]
MRSRTSRTGSSSTAGAGGPASVGRSTRAAGTELSGADPVGEPSVRAAARRCVPGSRALQRVKFTVGQASWDVKGERSARPWSWTSVSDRTDIRQTSAPPL